MKVKELREKYKLTQAALAKSLGVSSITISAVETGRTKVSKNLSDKIREVYGETVEPETKRGKTAEKAVAKKTRTARKKTGPFNNPLKSIRSTCPDCSVMPAGRGKKRKRANA